MYLLRILIMLLTFATCSTSKTEMKKTLLDVSCVFYYSTTYIICMFHSSKEIPKDATYSVASRQFMETHNPQMIRDENNIIIGFNATVNSNINESRKIEINISSPVLNNSTQFTFPLHKIEVLSPPENIKTYFQNNDLYLNWSNSRSLVTVNPICFKYEISIYNGIKEKREEIQETHFVLPNIDRTKKYIIKLRVKKNEKNCRKNQNWSNWSEVISVDSIKHHQEWIFLPLILLSFLLFPALIFLILRCPSSKILKVVFPPIPVPANKIKLFLEKDRPMQPPVLSEWKNTPEDFIEIEEHRENVLIGALHIG
ncbi:interleukin-5 receptor subunit alpha-like [Erpetoichthys calabaricus]|uniref:interleukin-5 receptor subunit alpha-like n=1 Tax=Erpetoichthys calabaricus TaxID=27687 RepID=UPI002234D6FB|nr:interleukin-5 receptor subunit alpha-like [Erpetoichthys calabaricus]